MATTADNHHIEGKCHPDRLQEAPQPVRADASQFLTESTVLGLIGGTVGASLRVLLTVAVSAVKQWTPVMAQRIAVTAPVLGAAVGLVAGLYPALRAASWQPVDALRAGP